MHSDVVSLREDTEWRGSYPQLCRSSPSKIASRIWEGSPKHLEMYRRNPSISKRTHPNCVIDSKPITVHYTPTLYHYTYTHLPYNTSLMRGPRGDKTQPLTDRQQLVYNRISVYMKKTHALQLSYNSSQLCSVSPLLNSQQSNAMVQDRPQDKRHGKGVALSTAWSYISELYTRDNRTVKVNLAVINWWEH